MHLTQYLILEVCRECNLGKLHPQCPNLHPGRYSEVRHEQPVPDYKAIQIVREAYEKHGFRGRVGFHYYNEPLLAAERMWRLMERISAKVPQAEFVLWSNGTLLPEDCSEFRRFSEIHITDYRIPKHEAKNLPALVSACTHAQIHRWPLDNRLHGIGGEVSFQPCHRMFTEFIIDYFGNVHLCCYDWQGLASIGNVQDEALGVLIEKWQKVRRQIGGVAMDPRSPLACLKCRMRSAGFTRFIPEIGIDAQEEVRKWRS